MLIWRWSADDLEIVLNWWVWCSWWQAQSAGGVSGFARVEYIGCLASGGRGVAGAWTGSFGGKGARPDRALGVVCGGFCVALFFLACSVVPGGRLEA